MIDKKKLIKSIRIFLGIVFISAAVYRIFNYGIAKQEMASLKIPAFFVFIVIIFEILVGLAFMFNKYIKFAAILSAFFLILAIMLALIVNGKNIILSIGEIFVFNLTPTDILLHITFLILILVVYLNCK